MNEKLLEIQQVGGLAVFTAVEFFTFKASILTELERLTKAGHAVTSDTTVDENRNFLSFRIFHYLTCATCAKEKK